MKNERKFYRIEDSEAAFVLIHHNGLAQILHTVSSLEMAILHAEQLGEEMDPYDSESRRIVNVAIDR